MQINWITFTTKQNSFMAVWEIDTKIRINSFVFIGTKFSLFFVYNNTTKKLAMQTAGKLSTEFWPKASVGPTSFSRISAHGLRQDSPEAHEPKRIHQTIKLIYKLHVFVETSCSSWCICARNFYSLFSQPRKCQRNYQKVKL